MGKEEWDRHQELFLEKQREHNAESNRLDCRTSSHLIVCRDRCLPYLEKKAVHSLLPVAELCHCLDALYHPQVSSAIARRSRGQGRGGQTLPLRRSAKDLPGISPVCSRLK